MRLPAPPQAMLLPALLLVATATHAAPLPTIAAHTAKLERHDGFVPWYWDAAEGRLFVELPRPGAEFLYGAGIAGGAGTIEVSLDRGQLGDLALCTIERSGRRALIRRHQLAHRAQTDDGERARVTSESFTSPIIASLPIVAESGGKTLADATDFLLRDAAGVVAAMKDAGQGDWDLNAALSAIRLEGCGAFPRNSEFEATHTFTSKSPGAGVTLVLPDGHTLSLRVHHTFLQLPEPGFESRAFDPRVGFFTSAFLDHAAPWTEPLERAFIARWRLVKKNPGAARSEPVAPIVYYLDRGMPEPERGAVREAALWWNHAFEEAGFVGALEIRDLPEGASFLDARYSGIQWTNRAERAWSIGQAQSDPRTGEILHAVVILDSHRRRTTARMWENLAPAGSRRCTAGDSPDLAAIAADAPQAAESTLVLGRLRYLAAHEVGHTLGLEHNMAATTFGWGSVMDYLAPHIEAHGEALELSDAYPFDIGSYDHFAIRWGYTPGLGRSDLNLMVKSAIDRGVIYPNDTDARWNEYDWGPDPARWLAVSRDARRVMLGRFGVGQLRFGEAVYELEKRFNLAYLYHRYAILGAQHAVGGEWVTNAVAGDGQTPRRPVPAATQRAALEELLRSVEPATLRIPDAVLAALVPPPNDTPRSREQFGSDAGDAFSELSAQRVLARLVIAPLFDRARAAHLLSPPPAVADLAQTGAQPLTLDELLRTVLDRTWAPMSLRDAGDARAQRVAQRVALESAITLAADRRAAPEVRAAALAALERFNGTLKSRKGAGDEENAHLALARRDLAAFLEKGTTPAATDPIAPPPGRPIGAGAR